jgi:succinylglutamate desuccinylase
VAGHQALDQLFQHLYDMKEHINANLYAVLGNLKAYQERTRYLATLAPK